MSGGQHIVFHLVKALWARNRRLFGHLPVDGVQVDISDLHDFCVVGGVLGRHGKPVLLPLFVNFIDLNAGFVGDITRVLYFGDYQVLVDVDSKSGAQPFGDVNLT